MGKSIYISFLAAMILLGACKKSGDNEKIAENGKDRESMLKNYADSIIIPAYASFKSSFDLMQNNADDFVSNPTESSLISLRNAWANAYIQWQTVELFDFGPAEIHTLRNFYNIYPADTMGIVANFSNAGANMEVPASYPQQGFPALDYLVNGVASSNSSIVAYYTDPTEGSKRRAYIKRISDRMSSLLGIVIAEWNGPYKATFVSKTGLDLSSSTSLMVNGLVLHYERFIRSGKFGIPSGVMLNGVVAPQKVEAYFKKDLSLALAKSAHQADVDFFNGNYDNT
jgi:predicted lipoprotein